MAKYLSRAKRLEQAVGQLPVAQEILEALLEAFGTNINQEHMALTLTAQADAISSATTEIQELHDELESWYDNLPENFQNGTKGDAIQEAMDALDTMNQDIEEVVETLQELALSHPENMDDEMVESFKADLQGAIEKVEGLAYPEVMFPGMYS